MKLFEHRDFEQAILRAAEHFAGRGLRPAIIEKDYYVTEALRLIATTTGDSIIFKGGTSLSKGWNLIGRFSEDIDIFLDPNAFNPALGKNGRDRELKKLRDTVGAHPALTFVEEESLTIGGFGRNDRFSYEQRFGGAGEVANRVLLEAGTASGREPTTTVELRSYLGQFLQETLATLEAEGADAAQALLSVEAGLNELPCVVVDRSSAARLRRGQPLLLRGRDAPADGFAYAACGGVVVATGMVEQGELVPARVFNLPFWSALERACS